MITPIDANGDEFPDLIFHVEASGPFRISNRVAYLINEGNLVFTDASERIPQIEMLPRAPFPADLNGDGAVDLIATTKVYLNSGSGNFTDVSSVLPVASDFVNFTLVGDIDADGDIDIVSGPGGELVIALNQRPIDTTSLSMPAFNAFSPSEGSVGSLVTILGQNLQPTLRVRIGSVSADFTVDSDSEITITVPQGAATGRVTLETFSGHITLPQVFTVTGPSIEGLFPTFGPPNTTVTVIGSNLSDAQSVTFGGVEAAFEVESDSRITAVVPEGMISDAPVVVTTIEGVSESRASFTVNSLRPPEQESVLHFELNRIAIPVQHPDLVPRGPLTYEAWVYFEDLLAGVVMGRGNFPREGSDPHASAILRTRIRFRTMEFSASTGDPGTFIGTETREDLVLRAWYHVAGTDDGDSLRLFINGQIADTGPSPGPRVTELPIPFAVGNVSTPDGGETFEGVVGALRQVRVWDRALGQEELTANATRFLAGSEDGLVAYWPLDDGSGQVARDLGPNGLTLTLGTTPEQDVEDPEWILTPNEADPLIELFQPTSGSRGTEVTIEGRNFLGATGVTFNGLDAQVSSLTNTLIVVSVPEGVAQGPIGITTPRGSGTSASPFLLELAPPAQAASLGFSTSAEAGSTLFDRLNPAEPFTIEFWFYPESLADGQVFRIEYGEGGGLNLGMIWGPFNGQPMFHVSLGGNDSLWLMLDDEETLSSWGHISLVFTAGQAELSLNGEVIGQSSTSISAPTGEGRVALGQGGFAFTGRVRQFRIWERALTSEEIIIKALTAQDGSEEGLVAAWPLDEGQGQVARDIGPNGLDLTLGSSLGVDESDPAWVLTEDEGPGTPLVGDFNGDGSVGFPDFIAFAGGFGATIGQENYDAAFDLDNSGEIGFPDFIQFASAFGSSSKRAVKKDD